MKLHFPLILLCCLNFHLTAQIKNTYSFAQGDTTQVVITWDAWAETGDPISGCNIYRYEDQTNPINAEMITSSDSAYHFVDTTGFDILIPPRYVIKAFQGNNEYILAKPYAFSSIEFYTVNDSILQIHLHLWNIDVEFLGLSIFYNNAFNAFLEYPCDNCYWEFNKPFDGSWQEGKAFILNYYIRYTPIIPMPTINSIGFEFLYLESPASLEVYAEITFKLTFLDSLATTVGISAIPEANMNFSVYPNPASNICYIRIPEKPANMGNDFFLINLYNSQGVLVQQTHGYYGEEIISMDTGHLPPGLYLLHLTDGQRISRQTKLLIHR